MLQFPFFTDFVCAQVMFIANPSPMECVCITMSWGSHTYTHPHWESSSWGRWVQDWGPPPHGPQKASSEGWGSWESHSALAGSLAASRSVWYIIDGGHWEWDMTKKSPSLQTLEQKKQFTEMKTHLKIISLQRKDVNSHAFFTHGLNAYQRNVLCRYYSYL